MQRLGGTCISTENAREFSSVAKGETLEDTSRVVSAYSDCIVLRHDKEGSATRAASVSAMPIINAGDGRGQHPTQALLDIYTIEREIGRLNNFKIAMVGDLANGRTVHSLSYLLGRYPGVEIIFVSPEELKITPNIKDYLRGHGTEFREETNLQAVLPHVDIIYMTRIQKERMTPDEYEKTNGHYVLDTGNLDLIRPHARIMHPLPRIGELDFPITTEQKDARIAYFRQAENGLYIRMAVLRHLLQED